MKRLALLLLLTTGCIEPDLKTALRVCDMPDGAMRYMHFNIAMSICGISTTYENWFPNAEPITRKGDYIFAYEHSVNRGTLHCLDVK